MKILFDHSAPFLLAHGGQQIQIEETKRALEQIGIEVEWLRWWDSAQTGNIIHYFGICKKQMNMSRTALFTEATMSSLFSHFLLGR